MVLSVRDLKKRKQNKYLKELDKIIDKYSRLLQHHTSKNYMAMSNEVMTLNKEYLIESHDVEHMDKFYKDIKNNNRKEKDGSR